GRSLQSLSNELQCDSNVLGGILDTLKELGYVMDSPEKNNDRWFLSCDPARTSAVPIIDTLLLDCDRAREALPAAPLNELLAHALAPQGKDHYTLAQWFAGPSGHFQASPDDSHGTNPLSDDSQFMQNRR